MRCVYFDEVTKPCDGWYELIMKRIKKKKDSIQQDKPEDCNKEPYPPEK